MFERFIEILKVIFLGVVEGISEWLPISSTGHMLLVDEFIKLNASDRFKEMFFIVIQVGAVLAVITMFYKKIFPFKIKREMGESIIKKDIMLMWQKVAVCCIPGVIATFLFDDFIEKNLHTPLVISLMLIIYGVLFILIEKKNKNRNYKIDDISKISYKTAFFIGMFQVLSLIPGTSRSGATIIGALLLGVNRVVATEFTFFLAIPVILGLSFFKIIKFGFSYTSSEILLLSVGVIISFLVSILIIKFLMSYIKKHDFKVFGIYRIVLGGALLLYFTLL